jgi:hypothetical protein
VKEMGRVLDDGGRMAANVWQPLQHHPVYEALLEAEARHLRADLRDVATPFMFGDARRLHGLLHDAGLQDVEITEHTLDVVFDDPEMFVALTVMAGAAVVPDLEPSDESERHALVAAIRRDCGDVLEGYRDGDVLRFPTPSYIATARA